MSGSVSMKAVVASSRNSDDGGGATGQARVSEGNIGDITLDVVSGLPIPIPSRNEVRIRVRAVGLNHVDVQITERGLAAVGSVGRTTHPFTPGLDCSGEVDSVGSSVLSFQRGDRVYALSKSKLGSYAEFCTVPEEEVFKLSDRLTYQQGAVIGLPYFTAYKAMCIMDRVKPGETVVIHGANSGCGVATVQMARAYGLRVIGTVGSQEQVSAVLKVAGAHHCFDRTQPGYQDKITEVTGDRGPDLIIETSQPVDLQADLQLLAQKGHVHLSGCVVSEITGCDSWMILNKECQIMVTAMLQSNSADMRQCGAAVQAGMEQDWLKPLVGKAFPLDDVTDAYRHVAMNTVAMGNVVLTL